MVFISKGKEKEKTFSFLSFSFYFFCIFALSNHHNDTFRSYREVFPNDIRDIPQTHQMGYDEKAYNEGDR